MIQSGDPDSKHAKKSVNDKYGDPGYTHTSQNSTPVYFTRKGLSPLKEQVMM